MKSAVRGSLVGIQESSDYEIWVAEQALIRKNLEKLLKDEWDLGIQRVIKEGQSLW